VFRKTASYLTNHTIKTPFLNTKKHYNKIALKLRIKNLIPGLKNKRKKKFVVHLTGFCIGLLLGLVVKRKL